KFDVPGPLDKLFQVNIRHTERLLGFMPGGFPKRYKFLPSTCDAHSPSAAACRGFDDQGIADTGRFGCQGVWIAHDSLAARHNGYPCCSHLAARLIFLSHQSQDLRRWPDKRDMRSFANLREIRILGQKPVARMYSVDIGNLGCADYVRDVQITV